MHDYSNLAFWFLMLSSILAAALYVACFVAVNEHRKAKMYKQDKLDLQMQLRAEQHDHINTRKVLNKHADELAANWHQAKAKLYDAQCEYKRDTAKLKATQDELARWRCNALDILEPLKVAK